MPLVMIYAKMLWLVLNPPPLDLLLHLLLKHLRKEDGGIQADHWFT